MSSTLALSDQADEEVRKAIGAQLGAYNESQAGPSNGRPLVITVRDVSGNVTGGLWGYTGYGWLFTQLLVVPPGVRGQGLGTRIMQMAEQEAVARACHSAWLDTFEFQARAFYERLGYQCFSELADYPTGYARYFMKKTLPTSRKGMP